MVGEGAIVDYYTDQRESEQAFHIANIQAHVAAKGVFASHAFSTGAKIMRHDIGIGLKGEGADCTMNGVYLADGERLLDTHTSLDHAMPHCTSHEIYKGILAGKAKAVFNGRIIVRIDAQKTNAKQTNRALLLSDDATINSNPQLEIFADDVKCTHGAAVGQLDEEAMFYLQARGLTRPEARDMLLHAFAGEVIEGVKIPALREQIEANFFATLARDVAAAADMTHDTPSRQKAIGKQAAAFDVAKVRADFPILSELVHGKPLVYLDSANTSQKPLAVIKATDDYYRHANANIHRATHLLSERATALYEGARAKAATFLNAGRSAHHRPDQGHHRRHQPGGAELRAVDAEARRRDRAVVARAPLEHRAVAAGGRADRRHDQGRADQRSRRDRSGRIRAAAVAAHEDRRGRPRLERARHDQSGQGDDRAGARRAARWCWSTARRRRRTW